jgi:TonB-linked outer membrane protein, SusC/RagA family
MLNMMNSFQKRRKSLGLLFVCLFPLCAFAQTISVSGVVKDDAGETLPGVSVIEVGTTAGTISDFDGKYQLTVKTGAKLTFSYIGYKSQTIDVNGRQVINVTLKEDTEQLSEVVVVGYGTMKRSDLTGAVTSVASDAITKSIPTSVDQVLQGRAAGVQVQQNSGQPGASTSIRIRGTNSLNASNEPIYVIDGVIIDGGAQNGSNSTSTNALSSINPADIVSMDILKDASATAIYGARASNGVIIITTKRGEKGGASINYSGYVGWQELTKKLDMLNLRQFATHHNALADLGLVNKSNNFVRPDLLGDGTNWQDELFGSAMMHSHNLSISGGNEQMTYNLSGAYLNQEGVAQGSGFDRINLNGSFDSQVKKYLKVGVSFAFHNSHQQLTISDQSLIGIALRMKPDVPVRNADGSFGGEEDAQQWIPRNPIAFAQLIDNHSENYGIRTNTYAEVTIIKGLTYRSEISTDYNTGNTYRFEPTWRLSNTQYNEESKADNSKRFNKFWSWRNVATFNRKLADVHNVNAMAGQEMQKSSWDHLQGSRTGFPTNGATDLTLGDRTTAYSDGYTGSSTIASFFGRLFYSFDDRYLLTTTIRYDGSSKFAPENRWGWFPSAALAWRASEESFLVDNPTISNLKLRAGWGLVGNQNIPDNYAYIATYGVTASTSGVGLIATNTPNPDLKWESTSSSNVGVDLGLFDSRVEFILDFYYKKTNNLLLRASLPAFVGTGKAVGASSEPWVNLGSLENKGFEITLNTINIDKRDFTWNTNVVFSLNRNKVLAINTETGMETRSLNGNEYGNNDPTVINRIVVGEPVGHFYGYQVIGRFEKAEDFYYKDKDGNVQRTPILSNLAINEKTGVWIGDYIYKDQNSDGKIDTDDMTIIGNPEPKFTFGVGNTFTYKNLDLSVFLSGSYGNDIINYPRRYLSNPYRNISNLFSSALDYAQLGLIDPNGPNDYRNVQIVGGDPKYPRMPLSTANSDYNYVLSDRFVEDGSFLRIQNVSIGYKLPGNLIKKMGIQSLKVYANLQNLYTFTKYSGYDPEIGSSYADGNWLSGVDNGRYPSPRIYTVGINLTF